MNPRRLALLHCLLLFSLATTSLFAGREFPPLANETTVSGEIIVKLAPGAPPGLLMAVGGPGASSVALNRTATLHLLKTQPGAAVQARNALLQSKFVDWFEPNRVRYTQVSAPSDPSYASQWALTTVEAVKAWSIVPNVFLTGASPEAGRIKIAILDTGTDCTHPDFMNSGATSTDAAAGGQLSFALSSAIVPTTRSPAACAWQDDYGHGTHVAGIVAAATQNALGVAGLGYPVEVVTYKILDSTGSGTDANIAQAIMAATDAGARVVSMSLGGAGYSQSLQDAVRYAWNRNVVVVAAAGNSSTNSLFFPAGANFAIGVAATDSSNNRASFSNFGNSVDIAAPGVSILSTLPTYASPIGGQNYGNLSGTSMATPHVAAVAGLLALTNPAAPSMAVAQRLQQSASSSAPNGGWGQYLGYGILDAYTAVAGLLRTSTVGGVTGQVVDATNLPVGSATVSINGQSFTTAADGLFRFSNIPVGTYQLLSSAAGFSMQALTVTIVAGADTAIDVPMGVALGQVTGSVSDLGSPVAGAIVQASVSGAVNGSATTDSNGAYTLWLPAGTYSLNAGTLAASGTPVPGVVVSAAGTVYQNLSLSRSGTVTGMVTDGNGVPVASAQVSFTGPQSAGAITDASGHFTSIGLVAGNYSATASANGIGMSAAVPVTVAADATATANFQLAVGLSSVSLSPATVNGGASSTGTVRLSGAAPAGGVTVALASADTSASVPASVVVAQGSTSATFAVATSAVAAAKAVTITATVSGKSASAVLNINAAVLSSLALSPNALAGGSSSTANTVTLNAAAPAGGAVVTLTSSDPSAVTPASVTVAAGATSAKFTITTSTVAASTAVTITASYGSVTKTATLTVAPIILSGLTLSPASTAGGNTTTASYVTLNGPAPAGRRGCFAFELRPLCSRARQPDRCSRHDHSEVHDYDFYGKRIETTHYFRELRRRVQKRDAYAQPLCTDGAGAFADISGGRQHNDQ